MIATVIRWTNDIVSVFDEEGNQMTEYQGRYDEVRDRILADAPESANFHTGAWHEGYWPVRRDRW